MLAGGQQPTPTLPVPAAITLDIQVAPGWQTLRADGDRIVVATRPLETRDLVLALLRHSWSEWGPGDARTDETRTMAHYRILYDNRGRVSGRDAYHVTVALWRDSDYLGLVSTWVSGIDLATAGPSQLGITSDLYWRFVADELCRELEHAARQGELREQWAPEIINLSIDFPQIATRAERLGAPEALRENVELYSFDA